MKISLLQFIFSNLTTFIVLDIILKSRVHEKNNQDDSSTSFLFLLGSLKSRRVVDGVSSSIKKWLRMALI